MTPPLRITDIRDIADFERCIEIQQRVWQMPDSEVVPTHLLLTIGHIGGLVLGAWQGEEMVGFVFGLLGRRADGRLIHHSHQAAVLPAFQSQGVGFALKTEQARRVAAQGIDLITWTYEPLEAANAHFNLTRLGAIARTYFINRYGAMRDGLNVGVESDRFEVEQWVNSTRVRTRLTAEPSALSRSLPSISTLSASWRDGLPHPPALVSPLPPDEFLIEIPPRFQRLKEADLELARSWRLYFRSICLAAFAQGMAAVALHRSNEANATGAVRTFYHFQRTPPGAQA